MPHTDERYSPTFLATFLGCRQAATWDLARRRREDDTVPAGLDGQAQLITSLGDRHEDRVREALDARAGVAVIPRPVTPTQLPGALEATRAAMDAGAAWVHQAALADGPWYGYCDFLRRVETPCRSWPWSYEPWDAKLARQPKPSHVLQIAVYAELLAALQGGMPARMGLMLGGGDRSGTAGDPWTEAVFDVDDFRWYVRRVADRALELAGTPPSGFAGEPCAACGQCHWHERCRDRWEADDHLTRVADITAAQRRRLGAAGITTLGALADLHGAPGDAWPAVRIDGATLARLAEQAALQRRSACAGDAAREDGADAPVWTLLPHRPGLGLDRLPAPDAGDLWFDFEGDPMAPGGLEYLCGVLARDGLDGPFGAGAPAAHAPVPERPGHRFRAFWAHDRDAERMSFQALVDAITEHLVLHPGARLYHYAAYERSALTRLAMMHGTREHEVDELLRHHRLVDLYRVVREGVRVGAPSYSIKKLEPLYMAARETDTGDGGQSVVMYNLWRASGEAGLLDDIEAYNRDDCVSTVLLHEWLLERSAELERAAPGDGTDPETPDAAIGEETEEERERRMRQAAERARIDALEARLVGDRPAGEASAAASEVAVGTDAGDSPQWDARRLAADLLRFHRREARPEYHSFFERRDAAPELYLDDADCLGGCVADPACWGVPDERGLRYAFRFPEQETKVRADSSVVLGDGTGAGTIVEVDEAARRLVLKRSGKAGEPPRELALMPGKPLGTDKIEQAVIAVAENIADGGDEFAHVRALLARDLPCLAGRTAGSPLVEPSAATDPSATLAATIAAVRALDRSWLCVQGPPGAGKTYTLARVISALIDDGRTVGVASNSHAAIDNVLAGLERFRAAEGTPFLGIKKVSSRGTYDSPLEAPMVVMFSKRKDAPDPADANVVAGTAWWFAGDDCPPIDTLVVDEAGQVSLGHLVAMAARARNIVLVGDPRQLAQPTRGAHPRASGRSCLEHAIGEDAVVAPERGIFLGTTFRMHPALARFVSEAIYDGRLRSDAGCANRRLVLPENRDLHGALGPHGLGFAEVRSVGCTQRSEAEADEIVRLYADLLACRVAGSDGAERSMTPDDIVVVAPYNVQVNLLRTRLAPLSGNASPRVGTVDRFQGQEAEVSICSMTTSDAASMPRDASFLLSPNRLNVAISRARCLAVVVASGGLLDLDARSVEEMRLANLLCRARAEASWIAVSPNGPGS